MPVLKKKKTTLLHYNMVLDDELNTTNATLNKIFDRKFLNLQGVSIGIFAGDNRFRKLCARIC